MIPHTGYNFRIRAAVGNERRLFEMEGENDNKPAEDEEVEPDSVAAVSTNRCGFSSGWLSLDRLALSAYSNVSKNIGDILFLYMISHNLQLLETLS